MIGLGDIKAAKSMAVMVVFIYALCCLLEIFLYLQYWDALIETLTSLSEVQESVKVVIWPFLLCLFPDALKSVVYGMVKALGIQVQSV